MLAKFIQTAIFAFYLLSKVKETIGNIPEVTVETLVILDKELSDEIEYDYARKVKYCDMFEEVQKIYDTLREDGINISINLSGLKLVKELKDQAFMDKFPTEMNWGTFSKIDFFALLSQFSYFVRINSWSKKYDAILFLTNKITMKGTGEHVLVAGSKFTYGACDRESNAAITKPVAEIIAHELGHMLGAQNDVIEIPKDIYSFVKAKRYIMSTTIPVDYLMFSRSSVEQFKTFLSSRKIDCLRETNVKDTVICRKVSPCQHLCIS